MTTNKSRLLKTAKHEYTKSYIEYDGTNRMEYLYEARANAEDGDPCLVTRYGYDGTSNRIIRRLESEGVWLASYDFA